MNVSVLFCDTVPLMYYRVGIIGEPLDQFNTLTLAPLGSEQDEENDEDQAKSR